jgi:hypothetical protein
MGTRKVGFLVLAALATAAFACSPLSNAISSTAGTAVSAAAATAGAANAVAGTESPSGGAATVSAVGNVALPSDTVPYEKGKVYSVGQAIKDDATGVIVLVNDVKFNPSLAGLATGQTWCLVTVTLGNAGTASYSSSSIGSLGIKSSSTGQGYTESLAAILSQVVTPDTQLDQDIAPGKAFQGILPVILPDTATGLVMNFTPIEFMSQGLTFQVNLGK